MQINCIHSLEESDWMKQGQSVQINPNLRGEDIVGQGHISLKSTLSDYHSYYEFDMSVLMMMAQCEIRIH